MLRLSQSAIAHPWRWLVGLGAVTLFFAALLGRLEVRTDGGALYPRRSPVVERSRADRARFHDADEVLILAGVRPGGPRLDTAVGLAFVAALHESLAARPGISGAGVTSLATWRGLDAQTGSASADDSTWAQAALRREPLVGGLYLAEDGRLAALYAPLAPDADRHSTTEGLERWVATFAGSPFEIRLLGPLVAETQLGDRVLRDLARLVPLMLGAIALLLGVALRTPGGVVVPLLEAGLVLVWTFGAMALFRVPVTLVTTVLPVVLMAMAITDEIHLLERLQANRAQEDGGPLGPALLATLREVGRPILATSLTTGIGFVSFTSAVLVPLRDFGIFTGFGLLVAMLHSFTLVPALLVLLPARWFERRGAARRAALVPPFEARLAGHGRVLLAAGVVSVLVFLPGTARLEVQDAWVENFDPRSPLVRAEADYNASFWGSYRYDIVVETKPGGFLLPQGIALLDSIERLARAAPHVGGVLSPLGPLGAAARALGRPADLRGLSGDQIATLASLAQMAEESTGLRRLLAPDASAARIRVHLRSADYAKTREVEAALARDVGRLLVGVHWHASGDLPIALEVVHAIVESQLRSIGWTFAGSAVVLLVLLRRVRDTAVALVPVTAASAWLFGAMGYARLPLGVATSMFASLSIGVGIDFALHLLHHYREASRSSNHRVAVAAALGRTGRAIRWNALVLACGLLVLAASELRPDRALGVLLACAVVACWATTLLFLPGLLRLVRAAVVASLLLVPAGARAQRAAAPFPEADPRAEQLARDVEGDFRRDARIVQMQIHTTFAVGQATERTLWGLLSGGTSPSRFLYVFTAPEPMRGLALLLQDDIDPAVVDSTWMHLPAFNDFRWVEPRNLRMMVPGTALTQEDARGFLPVEKYVFQFTDSSQAPGHEGPVVLTGIPRTNRLQKQLGYAYLRARIDPARRIVERVDYTGLDGRPLKTYELRAAVRLGDVWLPRRVRMVHHELAFESDIAYEWWLPKSKLEIDLFRPSIDHETFFPRLDRVRKRESLPQD